MRKMQKLVVAVIGLFIFVFVIRRLKSFVKDVIATNHSFIEDEPVGI